MEEKQIGQFIRDRRLELGLTQQQLADKLGITDKAVSKWERGISYPDITLLRTLADELAVSVTELLAGEREAETASPVPPEVEDVVLDTVSYAETARRRNGGWRFWTFVALTTACLAAALVLLIIYFANGNAYILLAAKCVAFGWALCYPLLRADRRPVACSLAVLTFAIVPFLWQILPLPRYPWAHLVALLAVAYLWAVYFICRRLLRRRMWRAAGWICLLAVPLSLVIWRVFGGELFSTATMAFTAGACFLIDFTLRRRA